MPIESMYFNIAHTLYSPILNLLSNYNANAYILRNQFIFFDITVMTRASPTMFQVYWFSQKQNKIDNTFTSAIVIAQLRLKYG